MDALQTAITALIKSGLTGEAVTLPEGVPLEELERQVQRHSLVSLVYPGACSCGADPALLKKWHLIYCRHMIKSMNQMETVQRICAAFDAEQIDYMPLKGASMKALYPRPEMRTMGDADILIRVEQQDRIRPIMEGLGLTEKNETDHEWIWYNDFLYLELHKRLIPSYNKDFFAYYGDGWQLARPAEGTRWDMRPEDEMVFLFTHFAKHVRDGGIGCRHVTDLWVFRRAHPELDETYIHGVLETLQLCEFYDNMCRVLAMWFESGEPDTITELITQYIFTSGNWGTRERQTTQNRIRRSKDFILRDNARALYLFDAAFPPLNEMREKYTVLKKAPVLLPLVWIYRPFYKIFCERGTLKKQEQNLRALSAGNLRAQKQLMHDMGLDFNF